NDSFKLNVYVRDQRVEHLRDPHSIEFNSSAHATEKELSLGDLRFAYTVVKSTPENVTIDITMSHKESLTKDDVFVRLDQKYRLLMERLHQAFGRLKHSTKTEEIQQCHGQIETITTELVWFYQKKFTKNITIPWSQPCIIHRNSITT